MGRSKLLTKKRKAFLGKFWGYLFLPIIALGIWTLHFGAAPILVMSGLAVAYMLVQAPTPCGAPKRKTSINAEQLYCRKNAKGLLGGCDIIQHKWANVRLLAARSTWGVFLRNMTSDGKGLAAGVGALASTSSALFALGTLLFNLSR